MQKQEYSLQILSYLEYLQSEEGQALATSYKVKLCAEIARLQQLIDQINALTPHFQNKEREEVELHLPSHGTRTKVKKKKTVPYTFQTWSPSKSA